MAGILPQWAVTVFAVVAYAAGGFSGARAILEDIRDRALNIEFLMIFAALGAAAIGEWEEGALLLFLFTLSGALEGFAMDRTRRAIEALSKLYPEEALIRVDGMELVVHVNELAVGDTVLVKPGERIAADGTVLKGKSTADQSPITGESIPVYKESGDPVFAGSINGSGALEIQVSKPASQSTLSKIIKLIEAAQQDPAPAQRFFDRFSQPYTVAVLAATALTIAIPAWFIEEPFGDTFYRAMTLMVVASPCALIISTPASILSAIGAAARHGVLLKGGAYLDKTASIDAVAFDKTGTLTDPRTRVAHIQAVGPFSERECLRFAAALQAHAAHPLASAFRDPDVAPAEGTEVVAGHGVCGRVGQHLARIGSAEFCGWPQPPEPEVAGKVVYLSIDAQPAALFVISNRTRPDAAATIGALQRQGLTVNMLSGDNADNCAALAAEVGIDYIAGSLPEAKPQVLQQAKQNDGGVLYVGDGVNDLPALASADVSVATLETTDLVKSKADVLLLTRRLSALKDFLHIGRRSRRIMHQNLMWALGYNLLAIPLAALGYAPPWAAALGMSLSSLLVMANATRILNTPLETD